MRTRTKALLLAMCAVLLVASTVVATVAYLTFTTGVVKNTFTVGNVKISLDEAPVDGDGRAISGERVTANNYLLYPGKEYDKDPTIQVATGSSDCWLFVKVVDEIAAIQDADTVAAQMTANGWSLVSGTSNIYAYNTKCCSAGDEVVVFESFKIKSDVTNEQLAAYAGKTITVQAYAIQAEGFDTAEAAWAAAPLKAWTTPST